MTLSIVRETPSAKCITRARWGQAIAAHAAPAVALDALLGRRGYNLPYDDEPDAQARADRVRTPTGAPALHTLRRGWLADHRAGTGTSSNGGKVRRRGMKLVLAVLALSVVTPALAGGMVGGHGQGGEGGHGPPGVCRNGPCNPPHGSTMPGGNKGSKCKLNGEGCGKQF